MALFGQVAAARAEHDQKQAERGLEGMKPRDMDSELIPLANCSATGNAKGARGFITMSKASHDIGWIGLGRMGEAMAARLVKAGHELSVWNRTASKADPLAQIGAEVVDRQDGDGALRHGLHHGLDHRRPEGDPVRRGRRAGRQCAAQAGGRHVVDLRHRLGRDPQGPDEGGRRLSLRAGVGQCQGGQGRQAAGRGLRARRPSTTPCSRCSRRSAARRCMSARASCRASGRSRTTPCSA